MAVNNETRPAEDEFTTALEQRTAQVPSTTYLGLALGAMAISAGLKLAGKNHLALFVGQWAAPFLLMGIYNKMVKQHGSNGNRDELASRNVQKQAA
jgi:hypothetical protein